MLERKKLIVMDNAAAHCSSEGKQYINKNQIPVLFSGVASFLAIPDEIIFEHIKRKISEIIELKS
jgi:hypothetical protein